MADPQPPPPEPPPPPPGPDDDARIFAPDALAGRVALITGGGTNLGRAAAGELIAAGATVAITGRRAEVLQRTARELGERCVWIAGDIREPETPTRLIGDVLARLGRLDLLLNNAGGQYFTPAEGITVKGFDAVQRLNLNATLAMCEAAHRWAMAPAGSGTIVNVTVSPHRGFPAMAHSGVARAAVEALSHELAERWGPDGTAVLALALGRLDTDSLRKYPNEIWRRAAATVPLQRLGDVREYGWLVALLATPLGRALSGSVVTLDGALDDWTGPWPPTELAADGHVPTEARRPAPGDAGPPASSG